VIKLVQANEHNNLLQSVNKLKTLITDSTEDIVINGSSSLITSSYFNKLKEWIPKSPSFSHLKTCRLDLLYKGSRDGFTAKKFHEKCDSKSPTISFIKSQTYGRIFGGYTEQTWNQVSGFEKKDEKAFIFSLTHNEKYPIISSKSAIYTHDVYSVLFGDGNPDIWISDNCTTTDNYTNHFPRNYTCSKFNQITEESKAYLAGSSPFKVEEIEVYQVVWI